jgi:hypothetical protein
LTAGLKTRSLSTGIARAETLAILSALAERGQIYEGRGETEMMRNAFDFRSHLSKQLSNLAELARHDPHQPTTNVVDINERLPLHLDMVVSAFLAQAIEASRKAGASEHRIFKRMAELASSVLDDPVRTGSSSEGPEEALRFFKMLAPAFFDLGLAPAQMATVLRYFAAAMAGEIEAKGMIEEAKALVVANRAAEGA